MIRVVQRGNFRNTEKFLSNAKNIAIGRILDKYGSMGVDALAAATPVRTGKTAASWGYKIAISNDRAEVRWINSNVNNGVCIAMILQYGHGTRTGGYVEGVDYINPAIEPIFEKFAEEAWNEVTR